MARYYNCPFYLVGSAQFEEDPRPDVLFLNMYGDGVKLNETIETWAVAVDKWHFESHIWKMWAKDISKQGKEMTMIAKRQVDFKTQPSSYFQTILKPRVLIPTIF